MPQFSSSEPSIDRAAAPGDKLSRAETAALTSEIDAAEKLLNDSKSAQGFAGKIFDGMKENLGGSSSGDSWPGRLWAAVLDEDLSSSKLKANLERARTVVASGDIAAIKQLRQKESDGKSSFSAVSAVKHYDGSQQAGVNFIADTAVLTAALASRGSGKAFGQYVNIAARGAVIKTAIKAIDGNYSDVGDDLATGAVLAATIPLANRLGQSTAPFSPTLSHAVEGAVIGHGQQTVGAYEHARGKGAQTASALTEAFTASSKNPYGALFGAATGGLAGYWSVARAGKLSASERALPVVSEDLASATKLVGSEKNTSTFTQLEADDLFTKPLSELKDVIDRNMLDLTRRVEQAGDVPRLAFHGAPQSRASIVHNFYENGVAHDLPFYIASPLKKANTASEKLADIVSSFKHASGYAGTPAHGKVFVFDASAADMSGMYIKNRPAALPEPFMTSANAGEKVGGLSADLKLIKVFEAEELRFAQPPVTLADYMERIGYLEPLELQRLANEVLKAAGI